MSNRPSPPSVSNRPPTVTSVTPGIPKKDEVPNDAGIGTDWNDSLRRHGLVAWAGALLVGGVTLLLVTGTVGASLVDRDATLGPPRVIAELDDTPTLAVVAGDYAGGVAVTDGGSDVLFGATDRPLPPPDPD